MYIFPYLIKESYKYFCSYHALGKREYSASCVDPKPSKKALREPGASPWFVTGFTDAEGCFSVSVYKDSTRPIGWRVSAQFLIGLHKKDIGLLNEIKNHLGDIGRICKLGKDAYVLRVDTINQMVKVIDHFDKYPLISQKYADYLLWKEIILMMQRKEHITEKGLLTILSIRASLNLGLSESLKIAFPNIIPVLRPEVANITIPHGEWLAGFTSGEGCFFVSVNKSSTHVSGFKVQLIFQITQHSRDERLIQSLIPYLGCGNLVTSSDNKVQFRVGKFKDNLDKIIKFFDNHQIRGVKLENFKDWCIVAKLVKDNIHLTPEGINEIRKIKIRMNKGRV